MIYTLCRQNDAARNLQFPLCFIVSQFFFFFTNTQVTIYSNVLLCQNIQISRDTQAYITNRVIAISLDARSLYSYTRNLLYYVVKPFNRDLCFHHFKNETEAVTFFFFDCMQCKVGLSVAL